MTQTSSRHRVVIVGGGFGGLYAAKALGSAPVDVTLMDKRNFHLFQPLLYQVATGTLSPADISSPLRGILSRYRNIQVLMEPVIDLDPEHQCVVTPNQQVAYDSLIIATGVRHHYFGNEAWQRTAPGLKTIEDALEMRRRIFLAFEAAEKEPDTAKRLALLTFVIVGGGPTGVELAGAIAELAFKTLKDDFRNLDITQTRVLLLEGLDRILPPYPASLSAKAATALQQLGVTIQTQTRVTNVAEDGVTIQQGDRTEFIPAHTVLWAAGVQASPLGQVLARRVGATLDRSGRAIVAPDLTIPGHDNIFVVGDLAHFAHDRDAPLPGIAPVAMQQGQYVAQKIQAQLAQRPYPTFAYKEVGNLAVIGQNAAVVDLGRVKLSGPLAWFVWVFAHIYYLIEFDNKLVVMMQWGWNYFTRHRGARIITGSEVIATSASGQAVPDESQEPNERVPAEAS